MVFCQLIIYAVRCVICIMVTVLVLEMISFLLPLCGCVTSKNVSSLTHLVYHPEMVSWGRALQVCESTGGRLIKVDTSTKTKMVNKAIATANLTHGRHVGQFMFDYWLGLKLHYTWTDGELMTGNWTGWVEPLPEPLMCAGLCVTGDLNGVWRQENCASRKPFICEFPTENNCTFTAYRGEGIVDNVFYATDGVTLDHTSAFTQNGSRAFCVERCLNYEAEGQQCWVWTYMQGSCVFYRSASPLLPNLETLNKNHTTQLIMDFLFKECYNVSVVSAMTDASTTSAVQPYYTMTPEDNDQATTSATLNSDATPNGHTSPSTLNLLEAFVTETKGSLAKMTSPDSDPTTVSYDSSVQLDLNTVSTVPSKHCKCHVSSPKVSNPSDAKTVTTSEMTTEQAWSIPRDATVEEMMEKLKLNLANTSAYRRRHSSAPDDRPSAKGLGYVGVACICAFVAIIICFDLENVIRDIILICCRKRWPGPHHH